MKRTVRKFHKNKMPITLTETPSSNWSQLQEDNYKTLEIPIAHELIEQRAYQLYQQRGGAPAAHLDDWLEAERQLRQERDQSNMNNGSLKTF